MRCVCWTELLLAWLTAAWQQRKMRGRSRLATGGNRWDDDDDLEGGGPSRSKAAATGSKARYRRGGESSDEDEDGDGCCHSLKTFLRKKISWAVVALLLVVWYSEHVALRSKILYVQLELATLQADYTKASITADSTATALRALTHNVEEHAGAIWEAQQRASKVLEAAELEDKANEEVLRIMAPIFEAEVLHPLSGSSKGADASGVTLLCQCAELLSAADEETAVLAVLEVNIAALASLPQSSPELDLPPKLRSVSQWAQAVECLDNSLGDEDALPSQLFAGVCLKFIL